MNYTFTFQTLAAYQAAKAVGGDIRNALLPSSTINVARAAVSYIAELGRSVVDSVNLCVPYADGGRPGDVLCYAPSVGYFWEVSPRESWSADVVGQTYHDATTWPSSFVRIGYCFWREGRSGLICAMSDSGKAWSSDTATQVPGIYTSGTIYQGKRLGTWISGIMEASEKRWGSSYYVYSWPFPRATWNEMVTRIKAGTTGTWTIGDSSYTITQDANGGYVCTMTVVASTTFTCNPADYDYNFDRWYRENIEAATPGPAGTATAQHGTSRNDGVLNTRILYATGNSAAANYAVSYSVNAPDYGAGQWYIPSLLELVRMMRIWPMLSDNGAGFSTGYAYWSSTQSSQQHAWSVALAYGRVSTGAKTSGYQVRLVSAFYV